MTIKYHLRQERRSGNVKAKSTSKFKLAFRDFLKFVRKNIKISTSILITDEYKAYDKMLTHYSINHSNEYSNNGVHTNSIEGFWAILKRGIMGQSHWVLKKHLDFYILMNFAIGTMLKTMRNQLFLSVL